MNCLCHLSAIRVLLLTDDAQIIGKGGGAPGHRATADALTTLQSKDRLRVSQTGGTGAEAAKTGESGQASVQAGRVSAVDAVADGQLGAGVHGSGGAQGEVAIGGELPLGVGLAAVANGGGEEAEKGGVGGLLAPGGSVRPGVLAQRHRVQLNGELAKEALNGGLAQALRLHLGVVQVQTENVHRVGNVVAVSLAVLIAAFMEVVQEGILSAEEGGGHLLGGHAQRT